MFQGFNATITTQVDGPGRRGQEQIRDMKLRLHPRLQDVFDTLCCDPKTTIVILSGSERSVLDEVNSWIILLSLYGCSVSVC